MAKRFISFGSIDQFRTVIKNVQRTAQYVGFDEELQRPQLNKNAKMPVVDAIGTEKIHGTNASFNYNNIDGFWVQSRKNIITPEKDNAGCAFAFEANKDICVNMINDLANEYDINLDTHIISVYFEWAGGNIQKKSALTGLDKRAMIFRYFKVSPLEPQFATDGTETAAFWLETKLNRCIGKRNNELDGSSEDLYIDTWLDNTEVNIFNIMNFPTKKVTIDFNEPLMSQNKMIEMVEILEKNSPVGQLFGIDNNIGEGYVWTFEYKDNVYRFKTKGEEHSKGTGKVKVLKPVDEEFEMKKVDFVNNFACTESRMDQMYTEIVHSVHNGDESLMSKENLRQYLQLVYKDVIKEESDRMVEMGLEPKPINGMISKVAVSYFTERMDKESGL